MKQLNLNVTPEFARDLRTFMKARKIKRKSEAIRVALEEAATRIRGDFDFRSLIGLAVDDNPNPNPKFKTDDDLWKKG